MRTFLFLFAALTLSGNLLSQNDSAAVAVLEDGDLEKYAETVYPMSKEFKELGIKMEGKDEDMTAQWAATVEGKNILAKYGWDEKDFTAKFAAITWGYTYLMMKDEMDKLPEDQQAQMQIMMPMMSMYANLVHQDDMKLIKSHQDMLESAFKKLEEL